MNDWQEWDRHNLGASHTHNITEKQRTHSLSLSLSETMALTLRVVNVNSIGFESCSRCSTFVSPNPSNSRFVSAGCSKVEQISVVTEESENSLIQALVGIQGRGRSSSPQQLNVSLSFFLTFITYINMLLPEFTTTFCFISLSGH